MPDEAILTAMGKYNEELVNAGVMLAGEGLHPTSRGKRIRFCGPDRTVIDGPFREELRRRSPPWLWSERLMWTMALASVPVVAPRAHLLDGGCCASWLRREVAQAVRANVCES